MLTVLLLMTAGIAIGALFRNKKFIIKASAHLTNWAIFLLLFLLGVSVGTNKKIISNFGQIGYQAIAITIFAILGSLITAYITYNLFFKKK